MTANERAADEAAPAVDDLRDAWTLLLPRERARVFSSLAPVEAEDFFLERR